uniref:Interferon-induced GTP-binding protein Mx-like n=1 Tax=Sinocyclocheilus grahami TaxID=75366 RepID=A0A672KM94_SINGR
MSGAKQGMFCLLSSSFFSGRNSQNFYPCSQKMRGEFHGHLEKSIRPYIDLIDTLRSFGIHKDLALPTIAVIGDQSSGKSSVLEALSGIALPRGSGIVTRCPLELRLKKVTGGVSWKAFLSYRTKRIEFVDSSLVEGHVEKAQNELAGRGVGICDELITLEVMSPNVCDLTLIDLPGIARVPVKGQPEDIEKQIKSLIMKFIGKQETINMVVVPCNTDIATTEALKMAQEVDPEGKRTLAILTKPDLIDRGTEKNILHIVHNKVIPLRKGYIMVKCRGQQQIDEKISLEEAAQMERDFFQNHPFFRCLLQENKATIKGLAIKLTQNLVDHIKIQHLEKQIRDLTEQVDDLENRGRRCNVRIVGLPEDTGGSNPLKFFEKWIPDYLHLDTKAGKLKLERAHWKETGLSKEKTIEDIQKYRGRELPGFHNYRVFEMVVQNQVATLKEPTIDLLNTIKGIILKQCTDVADQCFRNYPLLQSITKNKIENIQSSQEAKAEESISELFEMEKMIFTQDPIFLKILSLFIFFQVVVQRMADHLPMMISFFMLKQSAQLLSADMLSLLEKPDVHELLSEDSDVSKRRRELQSCLNRLTAAQETMSKFEGYTD